MPTKPHSCGLKCASTKLTTRNAAITLSDPLDNIVVRSEKAVASLIRNHLPFTINLSWPSTLALAWGTRSIVPSHGVTIGMSKRSLDHVGEAVCLAGTDTSLCASTDWPGLVLKPVVMRLPNIIALGEGALHALAVAFILRLMLVENQQPCLH
jgi:hypothetical protein